jgi:ribonuclease Z
MYMLLTNSAVRIALLILVVAVGIIATDNLIPEAQAAGDAPAVSAAGPMDNEPLGRQPVAIVDGQYPASYFPNTELLGPDEMRITALGTGMPNLTRKSASISYLVELGNGDKFLFDIGYGAMANLFSLRPDFS